MTANAQTASGPTLDPVVFSILTGRLEQIADEMDATLYRSAFNPIIAEARDACHGLYHATTGETLVQGSKGLPIFVGAMAFAVKAVIDKVAAAGGGVHEGDTYIFNDPYAGGTHLNDFRLVRPLMRQGGVFAWLASVGHWLDIGGNVAGGYNPAATESFQEGVLIPPVRLFVAGVLQQDIVDILQANTRVPLSNWGDLNGQINALDLGERRFHALINEYGDATVETALTAASQRADAMMRENIRALPDGVYAFEDYLDNDGIVDERLTVGLDLTIDGDRMTLDFTRSSPPCKGPVNIARSTAVAACYVALKHVFTTVPANAGCLRPISFVIPDTTFLGVGPPRPVAGYTETILRMIGVVFGALAKADPTRAMGAPFGTINALSIAGQRGNGKPWVMFSFFGGGLGGSPQSDGLNHANNPISTATIPPAEILEASYPVMFTQWALRPDSAGAGQHRGGFGAVYEIEVLAPDGATVALLGERGRFAPFGVAGGGDGALNTFQWNSGGKVHTPPMASKITGVRIDQGERVRLETPGGGGWGDPCRRDPAHVARDVERGLLTGQVARHQYQVVIRADGAVDAQATAELRLTNVRQEPA
jgi:N-methylhydantoinase B